MPKVKIKSIIFDFGGVLVHGGYLSFLKQYCLKCLTPDGSKKIQKLEHQVNLGHITEKKFYLEIAKIFHVHLNPSEMHKLIVKRMRANKSLVRLIPKLDKAKIVLFSNSIGYMVPQVMKQDHINAKKLFDKVFLSNVIHLAKPDKVAYKYVLKKIKSKPPETLLVDDRKENLANASNLGMNVVTFKNTTQFKKELKKYQLV